MVLTRFFYSFVLLLVLLSVGQMNCYAQTSDDLKLSELNNFKKCDLYDSLFVVTLANETNGILFQEGTYSIDWGDGSGKLQNKTHAEIIGLSHRYRAYGVYKLVFSAKSSGGTLVSRTYEVKNLGPPWLGLGAEMASISCVGTGVTIPIIGYERNPSTTTYTVKFGDKTRDEEISQAQLEAWNGKIPHTYLSSHCVVSRDGFFYEIRAKNECTWETPKSGYIKVVVPPQPHFTFDPNVCTDTDIRLINESKEGNNAECTEITRYDWYISDGRSFSNVRLPGEIVFPYKGKYEIKLIASNGPQCSRDSLTQEIEITEAVFLDWTIGKDTICEGEIVNMVADIKKGDDVQSQWYIAPAEPQIEFVKGNRKSPDVDVQFKRYGIYQVQFLAENHCSRREQDTSIIVKADPVITFHKPDTICPGTVLYLNESLVSYQWNAWDGREKTPEWTITPATGWRFDSPQDKIQKYPHILFNSKGDYVIKVKVPGEGCDKDTIFASQTVTVRDSTFIRDVTADNLEICAGGKVSFISNSSADHLTYYWEKAFADYISFVDGTSPVSASPVLLFPTPGTYSIKAHLTPACGPLWVKEFSILVKKDPKVNFVLPDAICPGMYDFQNITNYTWYNNPPKARWKVEPEVGSPADGYTMSFPAGGITPVIDFKKAGTYTISVTLDPAGCPNSPDGLSFSKKIRVYNNSKTLAVKASENSICVDELVVFTNNSTVAEEGLLTYKWSVTPETGWDFYGGSQSTESAPTIQFTEDGEYHVKSVIQTCDTKDTTIVINVKRNPKVNLQEIGSICPGVYDMKSFTTYQWFKNRQEVEWDITGSGTYSYESGSDNKSLYPKIKFGTGNYTIAVKLLDVKLDCNLDSIMMRRSFVVYDTAILLNIIPDHTDVCEGNEVRFNNTSNGGIPFTYQWSIDKTEGAVFKAGDAGVTEQSPVIRFDNFGEYIVKVKITSVGGCNSREHTDRITVRGIPEVDFKPLRKICVNSALNITSENITYTPKGCDLTYLWSTTPAADVTVIDNSLAYPTLNFNRNDRFILTVAVSGQCGGTQNYQQSIDVIDTHIEALASSVTEGCTDNLNPVLQNTSTGDSLAYKWTITPADGWGFQNADNATMRSPAISITQSGNYHVKLEIQNICNSDVKEFDIRAYSSPVITAVDIQNVCENGFIFKGAERLYIDEQNDAVNNVLWTISPNGFTAINGTALNSSYPDLTFEKGTYQMKGQYWNGCVTPGEVNITVTVDEFIPIVPLQDKAVCAKIPPFLLSASPTGGAWTTTTPGLIMQEVTGDYYFDPYIDEDRDYDVVYTFANKSCKALDTMNMHIYKLPIVNAGQDQEICINNEPRILVPVEPVGGGWWEGAGVSGTDLFTPDVVGARILKYLFTAAASGCTNSDDITMTVWGLPDPTFVADSQYCLYADALFKPVETGAGNRFNWEFGDNQTGVSSGEVTHAYQQYGYYDVVSVATSVHECKDTSDAVKIEIVNLPPEAEFFIDREQGCGPHEINVTINPDNYTDKNLRFKWNFADQVKTETLLPPRPVTLSAGVWDTTYNVRFTVYNICDSKVKDIPVTVFSSPAAAFELKHEWECSPVDVLIKNTTTGNGNRYEWDFGDGATSTVVNPEHLFTTDSVTTIYNIRLIATNKCSTDTLTKQLSVRPQTLTAFFQTPKRDICVGEEICFTNHSSDSARFILNKKWDFGDGAIDSTWNACHKYRDGGYHKVHLFIDNGCGFDTISDYLMVHTIPVLEIQGEEQLCENDTFHLSFTSDQELVFQKWDLGDGETSTFKDFTYVYDGYGKYRVTLSGVSQSRGACYGETFRDIDVWPNPVISITPLDTAVCSPFLYKPEIKGEGFLTWTYGDGSASTSAVEHLYENTTDEVLYHNINVHAESKKGCISDYQGKITLYNVPRSGIDSKMTLGKPQKVEFINLAEMYDECIWYLPFGKIVRSFDNQIVYFNENGLHTISLVAKNRYGCQDSAFYNYQTSIKGMYFPNTFMPHSSDPTVSRFNAVAMGLKKYKLEIYDQYGNKVWETEALDGDVPAEGWDGKNSRGEQLPQGVYIWRAKATFLDDREWTGDNDSGAPQTTQGTVMLFRP